MTKFSQVVCNCVFWEFGFIVFSLHAWVFFVGFFFMLESGFV